MHNIQEKLCNDLEALTLNDYKHNFNSNLPFSNNNIFKHKNNLLPFTADTYNM